MDETVNGEINLGSVCYCIVWIVFYFIVRIVFYFIVRIVLSCQEQGTAFSHLYYSRFYFIHSQDLL